MGIYSQIVTDGVNFKMSDYNQGAIEHLLSPYLGNLSTIEKALSDMQDPDKRSVESVRNVYSDAARKSVKATPEGVFNIARAYMGQFAEFFHEFGLNKKNFTKFMKEKYSGLSNEVKDGLLLKCFDLIKNGLIKDEGILSPEKSLYFNLLLGIQDLADKIKKSKKDGLDEQERAEVLRGHFSYDGENLSPYLVQAFNLYDSNSLNKRAIEELMGMQLRIYGIHKGHTKRGDIDEAMMKWSSVEEKANDGFGNYVRAGLVTAQGSSE